MTSRQGFPLRPAVNTEQEGSVGADAATINLPATDHVGPVESCPGCGGKDFVVHEQGEAVFRCLSCATGWRYELGYIWPVEIQATASTHAGV